MIIGNQRSLFHKVLIIAVLVLVTLETIEGCAVNPAPCTWTAANGANAGALAAMPVGATAVGCPATLINTQGAKNTCTLAPGAQQQVTNLCVGGANRMLTVTSSAGTIGPSAVIVPGDNIKLTCTAGKLRVVSSKGFDLTSVTGLTATCN